MFKVGDRVTLIDDPHEGTVRSVNFDGLVGVYWDGLGVLCRHYSCKLRKVEETTTMDNPFIKTVTAKTLIKAQNINPQALGWADISIFPFPGNKTLDLVVGATFEDRSSCLFNKESLGNLLKMLQEVHDLMED